MAVFRVNKTKDYTVMSNQHLKDKNLSLKAIGLLSRILSLPDDWDYSINGLVAICKEEQRAVTAALDELKQYGYLVVRKVPPIKGNNKFSYVYDIYENPQNVGLQNVGLQNVGVQVEGLQNVGANIIRNPSSTKQQSTKERNDEDEEDEYILSSKRAVIEKAWKKAFGRKVTPAIADRIAKVLTVNTITDETLEDCITRTARREANDPASYCETLIIEEADRDRRMKG